MKKFFISLVLFLILPFSLNAQGLQNNLKGKILLQVEDAGQAWYVEPITGSRAFLGRPADAFQIMRDLGLGISESSYNSFNGYAPKNLSGKILLRVEANGEAYYVNPTDLKMHYLGRPADAFQVMRELGLGISNANLNQIQIHSKYNLYQVTRVVDGDTVKVDINGKEETIRLIGVDTPETVSPSKPIECYGPEASNKTKTTLEGKRIKLIADDSQGDKDKYDRLLRYIFLEDGTNFNELLISEGYAHEYTYSKAYKYQSEFKSAEQNAIQSKKGLWADNACLVNNNNTQEENTNIIPEQGIYNCSANTYNCSDFKTQSEAQAVFDYCMGIIGIDIHKLDGDNNGTACESIN